MSFCVVPLTNKMNKGMTEIITDISALSFLTATVAGYFIVLFASSSPLRKMMQISVTGAYRYNPVNMKNRNVGKLAEKISIKYLAYTYISRYKRKLAFNILSVTATFILFIVAGKDHRKHEFRQLDEFDDRRGLQHTDFRYGFKRPGTHRSAGCGFS